LLLLCATALSVSSEEAITTYNGHRVFAVNVTNEIQAKALANLEEDGSVDFWTDINVDAPTDIMVKPEDTKSFKQLLEKFNIEFETKIEDVQQLIDEFARDYSTQRDVDWKQYNTLEEIYAWLDRVAANNRERVKILSAGQSYEKRDLKIIQLGSGPKKVWIDSGIHAREWITPATTTYIINELLRAENAALLQAYTWQFLPVHNPDGYVHTLKARMWRKTRSPSTKPSCPGVDANRNFDFKWGAGGSSSEPCSETYHGKAAFSEPEAKHVSDFMLKNGPYHIAITVHSYSQFWMSPWGWTKDNTEDIIELTRVGNLAAAALKAVHGTEYRVGPISKLIWYRVTGSTTDWTRAVAKAKYTYALELRDKGRYGFVLPPNQIIPSGQETWAAINALALDVKDKQ